MKHTPGPWRIVQPHNVHSADAANVYGDNGDAGIFAESHEGPIAEVFARFASRDEVRNAEAAANARLIAAAPELLEALTAAADVLHEDLPVSAVIRAAIAKAEGRDRGLDARQDTDPDMAALDRTEFAELLKEVVALREWKAAHEAAAFQQPREGRVGPFIVETDSE